MKQTKNITIKTVTLIILCLTHLSIYSATYNFKILSNESGLSNSAVLSMCQDHKGYMWIGTCDGLNLYDGQNIQVFKPSDLSNRLSGNLIEGIIETEDNIFWIQTNYGLNRLNKTTEEIEHFNEIKGRSYLLKTDNNSFYLLLKNSIYTYIPTLKHLKKEKLKGDPDDKILDVTIDSNNILWIFKETNVESYLINDLNQTNPVYESREIFSHKTELLYCSHEKNTAYFIDKNHDFFEYNLLNNTSRLIANLENEIIRKGEVSSIIKHNKSFLIGFKTNGLLQLDPVLEKYGAYEKYELNIRSGVFCLVKDKWQDIVWVGTDGQGVYLCYSDSHTVKSTTFNKLYPKISKPLRAVFLDKEQNLWLGTKGDGMLRIDSYSENTNISNSQITHFSSSNSPLKNNSVYAFEKSIKDILWIGHDEGLNFYSYKERKIKNIDLPPKTKGIKYIHSICELNDSTLWLASVGEGIYKAHISGSVNNPEIKNIQRITIEGGDFDANYFFSLYKENDSILWFGNRGHGAYKINNNTMTLESFKFGNSDSNKTLNDVYSIAIDTDNNHWYGTSFGLVKVYKEKKQVFNETHGFPNNTIHGILEGLNNNLWLSTNQGILRFNRKLETFEIYNQNKGLEVIEFSDGAYFKDEKTGTLFFGGINGLVTISENHSVSHEDFIPKIMFSDLNIFGKNYNINDFISEGDKKLQLQYKQNFFSLKLTAIDYLNSSNYSYSYKLEGLNDSWIQNGKSNTISFTNIPPGNYTLHTKFKNLITNTSSEISSINIRIVPPWYRTPLAFIIYFLLYVLLIFFTIRHIKKWYKLKNGVLEARINERRKEELYESKLQFFTNITHELCTPLTLIQGPSEKILAHPKTDHQIKKYASLIINNSEKLNALIQELIEFRRVDTHNKNINIVAEDLSQITKEIAASFSEMAESKNITYAQNIENEIIWNSDLDCYSKILTNLIANAFKYTNLNGFIEVNLSVSKDNLMLSVINTGKGIKEDEISHIFDRYKILDAFEGLNKGRFPSRNGLGLAICQNLTQLLKGTISVTSIPSKQTQFKVTFPKLPANKIKVGKNMGVDLTHVTKGVSERIFPHLGDNQEPLNPQFKSTILVIDDDEEMLWFLSDIFSNSYQVIKMNSSIKALSYLEKNKVDLIISDILMDEIDGISLTRAIKQNKLLGHIPILLLSAVNSTEYQVKGIEAGADIYLLKPFNIKYLTEIVNRFITRNENLKEYHNSIFSAFNLEDGNFIQNDDKVFMDKVLETIEKNISDSNLSADLIAEHIGYSKRNLYRKLKQITGQSLMEIIKEYRFKKVEKLLISTKMSTDEIIFKAGFHNRGHFFKNFKERHSITPKEFRNNHIQAFEADSNRHIEKSLVTES